MPANAAPRPMRRQTRPLVLARRPLFLVPPHRPCHTRLRFPVRILARRTRRMPHHSLRKQPVPALRVHIHVPLARLSLSRYADARAASGNFSQNPRAPRR
jgi:hypothetical protein